MPSIYSKKNVPDWKPNDKNTWTSYPFAGYQRYTPDQVLNGWVDPTTGVGASPYSRLPTDANHQDGSTKNTTTGLSYYSMHLGRLEVLITATGVAVTLLHRKWEGTVCTACVDYRRGQPLKYCNVCYGTGFVGGYDQYINARRPDGKILERVSVATEDLNLKQTGYWQEYMPSCWVLPVPHVKDRDVIVVYNQDGTEAWRYEILKVTRNYGLLRDTRFLQQTFDMQRFDKTAIIYKIPLV